MYKRAFLIGLVAVAACGKSESKSAEKATDKPVAKAPTQKGKGRYPFLDLTKWGYIDDRGNVAIAPRFETAYGFAEGRGIAKLDGKWVVIDETGAVVYTMPDEYAPRPFHEGLSLVSQRELIDTAGKVVVTAPDGVFLTGESNEGWISTLGALRPSSGFMDRTGKPLNDTKYDQVSSFSEGLAAVARYQRSWEYIDKTGATVIAGPFEYAETFHDDRALVAKVDLNGYPKEVSFIDRTGQVVAGPFGPRTRAFSDGLACVEKADGSLAVIDPSGKERMPAKEPLRFTEGFAAAQLDRVYVGKDGKTLTLPAYLTDPGYNPVLHGFADGLARIDMMVNGSISSTTYIDRTGAVVYPK